MLQFSVSTPLPLQPQLNNLTSMLLSPHPYLCPLLFFAKTDAWQWVWWLDGMTVGKLAGWKIGCEAGGQAGKQVGTGQTTWVQYRVQGKGCITGVYGGAEKWAPSP